MEMKQWFGGLTLNVVFRMVAGKRCFMNGGLSEEEAKSHEGVLSLGGIVCVGRCYSLA